MNRILFTALMITGTLLVAITRPAMAQTYPYVMDFEPANTIPVNKNSYAALDTILADSIQWIMPGVHLGTPVTPPGDFFNGSRSARIRLTDNTQGTPGYLEMLEDFPAGMGFVRFTTAMYGDALGGKLMVWYSTDSGAVWLPAGDTISVPPNANPALVTRPIGISAPVRVKIANAQTTQDRINIDDVTIGAYGVIPNVLLTSSSPSGADIPLTTHQLLLHFNHPIAMGQGVISIHKINGGSQSLLVPDDAAIISDSILRVSGLTVANNADYYVLLDDSIVHLAGGTAVNLAIQDSTIWTFSTIDTIPPPPPPMLTQLQESFLACNTQVNMMGVFQQHSLDGGKTWDCSGSGHYDSFCVAMSGGWYTGVSENSNDWLITSLPLDLSQMDHPVLSLWQKKRFEGSVKRTIRISTNYSGTGNPEDSGITWTTLEVPELLIPPANSWTLINGIDLQPFADTPFYLAVTYECADTGAYVLFYDDIRIIEQPVSIQPPPDEDPALLNIIGNATGNRIRFLFSATTGGRVTFLLFDANGRRLATKTTTVQAGQYSGSFTGLRLPAGIYLLQASGTFGDCTAKVMIR